MNVASTHQGRIAVALNATIGVLLVSSLLPTGSVRTEAETIVNERSSAGVPERPTPEPEIEQIDSNATAATQTQLRWPVWQQWIAAYELLTGPISALRPDDPAASRSDVAEDEPVVELPHAEIVVEEASFSELGETTVAAHLPEPVCVPATTVGELTEFFDRGAPLLGADYQRAFALPDGRVLWLFQDAFLATPHGPELVHNVGLLQSGRCFQLLRTGTAGHPQPYLFPELTDRHDRWFWPLAGGVDADGDIHVFVGEFRERSSRYLGHTEPVATWLVSIDVETFSVVDARPAPNSTNQLYGWSVVSEGDYSYLYAHCYRQFGWDLFPFGDPPFRAHDWTCGPDVTVARIPRSDFRAKPEYWNGSNWVTDPEEAVPVIPRDSRSVNPTQVALFDGRFIAVTKVGDWWGDTIYLDVAPSAEGPWETYEAFTIDPDCAGCNTYFASIVPYGADGDSFVIGVSGNTWAGNELEHYSPRFLRVPAPTGSTSNWPASRPIGLPAPL